MIGLCLPPKRGEADAAYYAAVCEMLRPPWWHDWRHGQLGAPGYVPMLFDGDIVRLQAAIDDALFAAADMPPYWLIYNEPESAVQGDTPPAQAANALRIWLRKVPSWYQPIAVGGINVTLHRAVAAYEWLEEFVAELGDYIRFVDYWHIHAYGPADVTKQAVLTFRDWMRESGHVRPVILSECGTDNNPAALMQLLRAMITDGVLEAAAWFSAYYEPWNDTGLLDADGNLTAIGEAFVAERHVTYLPEVIVVDAGS